MVGSDRPRFLWICRVESTTSRPYHPLVVKFWIRWIPAPLVRFFASPYVAGDSLAKAMTAAAELSSVRRLRTTLDLLAEGITSDALVQQNIATYLQMVDAVAADTRFADDLERPTLSLKLSSYTTDPLEKGGKARGAREAVFTIAEHAKRKGVRLTLDMESASWTDFTITVLRDLHAAGHSHVGCVVQARLNRTEADLDALPKGIRTRIVIGIYKESATIALTDKAPMKDRMLVFARKLLDRGHYVEFATHDETYVRRFLAEVVAVGKFDQNRYEVQMLYGVPRQRLLEELVSKGVRCRLYVPFALGWDMAIAYLRRRLDEYPAMMFLVVKNFLFRG